MRGGSVYDNLTRGASGGGGLLDGGASPVDYVKYIALAILVCQNSALALTMRYSRTVNTEMYIASTAVVVSEVLKLFTSIGLVIFEEKTLRKAWNKLHQELVMRPEEMMKLLVPAILYTIQNNLAYIAVSNLDAASYQVLYQLKILTTAIFSVTLLGKHIDALKWFALLILVAGVSLVQVSSLKGSNGTAPPLGSTKEEDAQRNNLIGLLCVILACCSSGFAGVYFEKVLKGSQEISVWVRNIELALIGIVVGLIGVMYIDADMINELGFFYGYSGIVWTVIALQALGGIIVAVVIRYTDNVIKGFATSCSIVVSCFLSIYFFKDFHLSIKFVMGTFLVILATMMYNTTPPANAASIGGMWGRLLMNVYMKETTMMQEGAGGGGGGGVGMKRMSISSA